MLRKLEERCKLVFVLLRNGDIDRRLKFEREKYNQKVHQGASESVKLQQIINI